VEASWNAISENCRDTQMQRVPLLSLILRWNWLGEQGELPANFKQTKTIDDDLNPTWDEIFQFGVHSTTIQELVIEVWDEDNAVTGDELLGTCQVYLATSPKLTRPNAACRSVPQDDRPRKAQSR
jgi:hypothetical protein